MIHQLCMIQRVIMSNNNNLIVLIFKDFKSLKFWGLFVFKFTF